MAEPLLEFVNLTVFRDETRVLDRFSLTIPAGQNVAILGPNGSGKSTLIKLVTRELYPVVAPDAAIRVLGRDRWVLSELREHIGIVSNDLMTQCTREITGRDLVLSAFFGSVGLWPHHVVTPQLEARADAALDVMEVGHLTDRFVDRMEDLSRLDRDRFQVRAQAFEVRAGKGREQLVLRTGIDGRRTNRLRTFRQE